MRTWRPAQRIYGGCSRLLAPSTPSHLPAYQVVRKLSTKEPSFRTRSVSGRTIPKERRLLGCCNPKSGRAFGCVREAGKSIYQMTREKNADFTSLGVKSQIT